jgi:capsular exopolysaccharide synthesis family protein
MSNIFEAVKKAQGEIAESILPLLHVEEDVIATARAAKETNGADSAVVAAEDCRPVVPAAIDAFPAGIREVRLHLAVKSPVFPFEDAHWAASEQYRILRTKITHHAAQPRLIVISSPGAGDGKTISAINLAGALSLKREGKVLLVDADLRRSAVHSGLGIPGSPGLADVLAGACTIEQALLHIKELPNLYVMPAGTPPSNPVELLDRPEWPALGSDLRKLFRYIIADSPPVAAVADYDVIQAVSDAVILIVRPDHTNRRLSQRALETVSKTKLIGVLLNGVPDWFLGRNGSPTSYYYSEQRSPDSRQ